MKFVDLKTELENILIASASGNFNVVGYQKEAIASSNVKDNNALVQLFNHSGSFDGGYNASQFHDVTIKVIITVSSATKADLTVLESESSSAALKASALASMRLSESECDAKFDEVFGYVWAIVTNAINHKMQQTDNDKKPASLKIKNWQKDEPIRYSNLTTLTGNFDITYRIEEFIEGELPQWPASNDKFYDDTTIEFYDIDQSTADSSTIQIEVEHDSIES